jgi:hypothetical protein
MNVTSIADNFNVIGQSIKDLVVKPSQSVEDQRLKDAVAKNWPKSAKRAIEHGANPEVRLQSLAGAPQAFGDPLNISQNTIKSLDGAPKSVGPNLKLK